MQPSFPLWSIVSLLVIGLLFGCQSNQEQEVQAFPIQETVRDSVSQRPSYFMTVQRDIPIRAYFPWMDSLVAHLDTVLTYSVDEHVLVRYNDWIIDTLENTDYYRLMERGIFEEDPQSLLVLREGDRFDIPDAAQVDSLRAVFAETVIDVNIPEFKLRIREGDSVRYAFPIRVGKPISRYLAMAGREVDLRTQTGTGQIVRINRKPEFRNPVDNHRYEVTRRDDGRVTKLPGIPWIEPEIDGRRYGHLIHPTTNPETLGKPVSNGCMGMKEADMWRVYYHAPIGTQVVIRYDLEVVDEAGNTIRLRDIYPGFAKRQQRPGLVGAGLAQSAVEAGMPALCHCGG